MYVEAECTVCFPLARVPCLKTWWYNVRLALCNKGCLLQLLKNCLIEKLELGSIVLFTRLHSMNWAWRHDYQHDDTRSNVMLSVGFL